MSPRSRLMLGRTGKNKLRDDTAAGLRPQIEVPVVGGGDCIDKRETEPVPAAGNTLRAPGEGLLELVQLSSSEHRTVIGDFNGDAGVALKQPHLG